MVKIVKPKISDIAEIQEIFYKTWLATYPNKKIGITKKDIREKFKNRLSEKAIAKRTKEVQNKSGNLLFLIAKENKKITGVCILRKDKKANHLGAIYVLPDCQRQGTGMTFWKKARKFFDKDKKIVVQVADYNKKAIKFYKKLGFQDTGKRFINGKHRMPISGICIPEMEMVVFPIKK